MGIYSSGNKWRQRAKGAEAEATNLANLQQDIDFGRQLLMNIRQQRLQIAQARFRNVLAGEFSTSSSAAGAEANINSTLAGEAGYTYTTAARMQQISNLQQQANYYYKKYQKQQKTRSTAIQATAIVAGAALGGVAGLAAGAAGMGVATAAGAAAKGAMLGATVGSGVGKGILGDYTGAATDILSAGTSYYGSIKTPMSSTGNLTAGSADLLRAGTQSGATVAKVGDNVLIDFTKNNIRYNIG